MTKSITAFGLGCAAAGMLLAGMASAAPDANTVAGIWLFDGDADDASVNGNHADFQNGAKTAAGGRFGEALSLDGENDFVLVPSSASLESTAEEWTGMAWINLVQREADAAAQCCSDDHLIYAFTAAWHNLFLVFGPGRGANQGKVEAGSLELAPQWMSGPTVVEDDSWHHLAYTYDGSTKTIWVDGVVDVDQAAGGTTNLIAMDMSIGGTATERWAHGLIDEVALFNVALSAADIGAIKDDGLGKTFGLTPVDPQGKAAMTWGVLKTAR
jgi:hypothetical protein